jgi:hypothetical protein
VGIRYIVIRPGIGLCNRRSPRNGSRKYVARRITPSTASEIVVIAATIVTPTKVLVTSDASTWVNAKRRGMPYEAVNWWVNQPPLRTHEVARWRETGEVAYERDFAVHLTLDDERIVRIVVMQGATLPSRANSGSQAANRHP